MTNVQTMNVPFVCPLCKEPVFQTVDGYECKHCSRFFPVLAGIPDFRFSSLPTPERERERVAILLECAEQGSYKLMWDCYGNLGSSKDITPKPLLDALRDRHRRHAFNWQGAAQNTRFVVEHMLNEAVRDKSLLDNDLALDLACGRGAGILGLSSLFRTVVGIDIDLPGLVVAKKLLEEQGVKNAILAAAGAEALPLPTNSVAVIFSWEVIEHVSDQETMLLDTRRVLQPGGALIIGSPNRFTLGKEPHVGIWGVGFVPRRWMQKYVQVVSRNEITYYQPSRYKLLSYLELRRLLRQTYGEQWVCKTHVLDRSARSNSVLGKLYRATALGPFVCESFLYKLFCRHHTVIAYK